MKPIFWQDKYNKQENLDHHGLFHYLIQQISTEMYEVKRVGDNIDSTQNNWYVIKNSLNNMDDYSWNLHIPRTPVLKFIGDNNIKLAIFHPHDNIGGDVLESKVLIDVWEKFKKYNITPHNVFIFQSNLHMTSQVTHPFLKKVNFPSSYQYHHCFLTEHENFDFVNKKSKKFILPVNKVKDERLLMLWLLKTNDLLRYGHYSMCSNDVEWKFFDESLKSEMEKMLKEIPVYIEKKIGQRHKYSEYAAFNRGANIPLGSLKEYTDCYFSIVFESAPLRDDLLHITEKTLRPFSHCKPFVVFGNTGTLQEVRKLGYETFPEFFNESYDEIKDTKERFYAVYSEVKKVCNMDLDKLHELYISIKDKLIHNRKVYLELRGFDKYFKKFFIDYEN